MFCRNCGKELIGTPEICLGCGAKPFAGNNFCHACGAQTNQLAEICLRCGARLAKAIAEEVSPKSRLATTLLAWFLGGFGAHRFYLGKMGTAIIMLILWIVGFLWWLPLIIEYPGFFLVGMGIGLTCLIAVWIWAFVDFSFAVSGHMKDKEGKSIKKW